MKDYNEPCVSLDTATMLQTIGFHWPCYACYDNFGVKGRLYYNFGCVDHNHSKYLGELISAPTLEFAQKYIREIFNIHITIYSSSQESWMYRITEKGQKLEDGLYGEDFYTYEEAQEEALKQAAKIIKNKIYYETK